MAKARAFLPYDVLTVKKELPMGSSFAFAKSLAYLRLPCPEDAVSAHD